MDSTTEMVWIRSKERGITRGVDCTSRHTFAFEQYHNLNRFNFGTLRCFNEDVISPKGERRVVWQENMEIVNILLEGSLESVGQAGEKSLLQRGDVQRISTGIGACYLLRNPSSNEKARLIQVAIYPGKIGIATSSECRSFLPEVLQSNLYPIVSASHPDKGLFIEQDAHIYMGRFGEGEKIIRSPRWKNGGDHIYLIDGQIEIGGEVLESGDTLQITGSDRVEMVSKLPSYMILIEVGFSGIL